jgi:hypothetical protein
MYLICKDIFSDPRHTSKNYSSKYYKHLCRLFHKVKYESKNNFFDILHRQKRRINNISSKYLRESQNFNIETRILAFQNLVPWYSMEISNDNKNIQFFLGSTIADAKSFFRPLLPGITVQLFRTIVFGNQASHSLKNQYCPTILKKVQKFIILEGKSIESNHYYCFIPFNNFEVYGQIGFYVIHQKLRPLFSLFFFKSFFFSLEHRLDKSIIRLSDKHKILMLSLQRCTKDFVDKSFNQMGAQIKLFSLVKYFIEIDSFLPKILDNFGIIIHNSNSFFILNKYSYLIFFVFKLQNFKVLVYFDKYNPVALSLKIRSPHHKQTFLTNKQKHALEQVWFY